MLSAACFVIAFDPFLNMLHSALGNVNHGITRACADDLGFVFGSFQWLPKLAGVLGLAAGLAGFTIKINKCSIVPLRPWSLELVSEMS